MCRLLMMAGVTLNAFGTMRLHGLRRAFFPSLISTVEAGADRGSGWIVFCLANVHIMREIVIRGALLNIHHLLNERRDMFCKLHNSIPDSCHNFVRP
jgi:hypothetical protein